MDLRTAASRLLRPCLTKEPIGLILIIPPQRPAIGMKASTSEKRWGSPRAEISLCRRYLVPGRLQVTSQSASSILARMIESDLGLTRRTRVYRYYSLNRMTHHRYKLYKYKYSTLPPTYTGGLRRISGEYILKSICWRECTVPLQVPVSCPIDLLPSSLPYHHSGTETDSHH
eukprot:scaffold9878_cov45-Attheya_sp.AAC.6